MVLYYVATYYQLLCALAYNMNKYSDQKTILIMDSFLESQKIKLQKEHCFSEVYCFSFIPIKEDLNKARLLLKEEFNSKIPYSLRDFEEIYVAGAQNSFSMLLIDEKVHFSIFEECSGIMSCLEKLRENVSNSFPFQDKYMYENGVYDGSNELIDRIYCDKKNQNKDFHNSKAINFNVIDSLNKLSKDNLNKIIRIFVSSKYKINSKCCILLTQHFANLKIMSWEEQIEIYQLFCDYFLSNYPQIIIKAHPADNMYYSKIISNSIVINEKFPSELLPFVLEKKADCIATISSTAISNLVPYFDRNIKLNISFEKEFYNLHRYFVSVNIAKEYLKKNYKVFTFCANNVVLSSLMNTVSEKQIEVVSLSSINEIINLPSNSLVLFDDILSLNIDSLKVCKLLEKVKEDLSVIFLNSTHQYFFYNVNFLSVWKNIYPIEISLSTSKTKKNEYIYLYEKDRKVKMSKIEKRLNNSQIDLSYEDFEGDKLRIKVLEGMLTATEERLRFYIKKVEEMEDKNNA